METREDVINRVSAVSLHNWHRWKANYKAAVFASLEEHILSYVVAAERDALLAHVNEYIDYALRIAQPNLRINGQNYELLDESELNTRPFDEALDRRIWSLADTRLQWQKRIIEIRRTLPQEIETTFLELFDQHGIYDGEDMVVSGELGEDDDMETDLINDLLPRDAEMQEGFRKTVALSEELKQTTMNQEERVGRVRALTGELKALKQ